MADQEKLWEQLKQMEFDYRFDTKERTVLNVFEKYQNDVDEDWNEKDDTSEIYIPVYQRSFKWSQNVQSEFIESLLLWMPIPYIFLADVSNDLENEKDKGRLEIVDWSQRIRTIDKFLHNELVLSNLQKLTLFNWCKFNDLPENIKRKFERRSIKWIEISYINIENRQDFFRRINDNWKFLNPAEIRKGTYMDSLFYIMMKEISETDLFKEMCPFSKKKLDKEEQMEYILRFFAYYDKFNDYNWKVKSFIDNYIKEHSEDDENMINKKKELLIKTFEFVRDNFQNWFKKDTNSSFLTSRVYFEAIAVWTALALKEKTDFVVSKEEINLWLLNPDFLKLVSSDWANTVSKFKERILYVKNNLLKNE